MLAQVQLRLSRVTATALHRFTATPVKSRSLPLKLAAVKSVLCVCVCVFGWGEGYLKAQVRQSEAPETGVARMWCCVHGRCE